MATQVISAPQFNEQKLIRAGQRGDAQAIEALFGRYHRQLRVLIRGAPVVDHIRRVVDAGDGEVDRRGVGATMAIGDGVGEAVRTALTPGTRTCRWDRRCGCRRCSASAVHP